MDELYLYKKFDFNLFEFNRYHMSDFTKTPIIRHYFACLINGRAEIRTKDKVLYLEPNEVFYIPKGLKYQSQWFGENGKEIKFYSLGFELSPIDKTFDLQKIDCTGQARVLFDELCSEIYSSKRNIGKLYYFFELVADSMKTVDKSHTNPIVDQAIRIMTENPNMKISDVARSCNVSEPGIYSLFRKHLGKTPNEVRNKILCDKAVLLLMTTNKSVQEISDMLGFSSTSYFRKILKAHTGKTAREIRKQTEF